MVPLEPCVARADARAM